MNEIQIKKIRLEKGLSQEQLAEIAKVSVRTIQRLESGQDVSIQTLNLVVGALGVEVKDLFSDEKTEQEEEKINASNSQLQYQLEKRREEYYTIIKLYNVIYLAFMLLTGSLFTSISIWESVDINGVYGVFWIFGWVVMKPLRNLLMIQIFDPKLDNKYPLTANRLDKDMV